MSYSFTFFITKHPDTLRNKQQNINNEERWKLLSHKPQIKNVLVILHLVAEKTLRKTIERYVELQLFLIKSSQVVNFRARLHNNSNMFKPCSSSIEANKQFQTWVYRKLFKFNGSHSWISLKRWQPLLKNEEYLIGSDEWLFTKLLGRCFGPWISRIECLLHTH